MNSTTAEILNQLQTAWNVGSIASTVKATPAEPKQIGEVRLSGNTSRCTKHLLPFDAIDEPDKSRFGFIRSKCRHCGRFLGYRRAE